MLVDIKKSKLCPSGSWAQCSNLLLVGFPVPLLAFVDGQTLLAVSIPTGFAPINV